MLMRHYEPKMLEYTKRYEDKKWPHDSDQTGSAPKKPKTIEKFVWVKCSDKVPQNSLTEEITADPRAKN
jgi:hypothetical protein